VAKFLGQLFARCPEAGYILTIDTLADYLAFLPVIPIAGTLKGMVRDPDDNAVLECAVTGKASFIITGDLDLLTLETYEGIEIVRPAEFLGRWETGKLGA